jgi:hypothetical protein
MQGGRGKSGIKITGVIIMNLENFDKKIHNFWMRGSIKINWRRKSEQSKG